MDCELSVLSCHSERSEESHFHRILMVDESLCSHQVEAEASTYPMIVRTVSQFPLDSLCSPQISYFLNFSSSVYSISCLYLLSLSVFVFFISAFHLCRTVALLSLPSPTCYDTLSLSLSLFQNKKHLHTQVQSIYLLMVSNCHSLLLL